jgi:hypothetical protein
MKIYKQIIKALHEAKTGPISDMDEIVKQYSVPFNWKKNPDGSYDVIGSVESHQLKPFIKNGKLIIRFNKVSGNFYCDNNQLISLEGCPKEVGRDFNCSENKLTSLKGSPKKINGFFIRLFFL